MKQIPKDKFVKLIRIANNDPVDVYDLEVEQDHEFYANGFLVHNCLGNYHPHGDKACYDAIVNAAINQNIAMVHGEGNFGTMTEGPAAMRYCFTEDAKVMVIEG